MPIQFGFTTIFAIVIYPDLSVFYQVKLVKVNNPFLNCTFLKFKVYFHEIDWFCASVPMLFYDSHSSVTITLGYCKFLRKKEHGNEIGESIVHN